MPVTSQPFPPSEAPAAPEPPPGQPESLARLLGGTRGAVDATVPVVGFMIGWLVAGRSIAVGAGVALAATAALAAYRLRQGTRPRAVLVGLLAVGASALLALYTGRAQDFFLVQMFANAVSALAWVVSIVLRWPLLGLVVGTVLGQRTRWRRDPALLRAYGRASWIWVAQYLVRLAVLVPLWAAGWTAALAAARVVLAWTLIPVCLAVSWWVLRRTLPPDHPGLRHPAEPAS
jgi:hypothetical protein